MSRVLLCNVRDVEGNALAVLWEGEVILRVAPEIPEKEADRVIDGGGARVFPGFVDPHVHLRVPGEEAKETLETGARAAAHGGFTTVVAMPNTRPPVDDPERLRGLYEEASTLPVEVLFTATLSAGREGHRLSEMALLAAAGAVAFTDDGSWLEDAHLAYQAYTTAAALGLPVFSHPEDPRWHRGGVAHMGPRALKLGLPGIPREAEELAVVRDLALARLTGVRLHLQHISSHTSIPHIQRAVEEGLAVTAEVTPHHLLFTDEVLETFDPRYKVNPPIREERDRDALRRMVASPWVVMGTDHAPHTAFEKELDWLQAPFGIAWLDLAFSALYTHLVRPGWLSLGDLVEAMTRKPARLLGLEDRGVLEAGKRADLVVVDLEASWVPTPGNTFSRGKNNPLYGQILYGVVRWTVSRGEVVYSAEGLRASPGPTRSESPEG